MRDLGGKKEGYGGTECLSSRSCRGQNPVWKDLNSFAQACWGQGMDDPPTPDPGPATCPERGSARGTSLNIGGFPG